MLNKIASKYLEKKAGPPQYTDEELYALTNTTDAPVVGHVTPEQGYKNIFPKDVADKYYQRMQEKRRAQFGEDASMIPQDAIPTIYTGEGKANTPYITNKPIPVKQPETGRGFSVINPNIGTETHHIVSPKTPNVGGHEYTHRHETVHPSTYDASISMYDPRTSTDVGAVPAVKPDTFVYNGNNIPSSFINAYDLPSIIRQVDPRYNKNKTSVGLSDAGQKRLNSVYGENYGDFFTYFGVPSEFNTTAANIKGIVAHKGMNLEASHDYDKVGEFLDNLDPNTLDDYQKQFISNFNETRNQLKAYENRIQYLESLNSKDPETQEILQHLKQEYETFKRRYKQRFDLVNTTNYNTLSNQGLGIG